MRKIKKGLALLLALAMVVTLAPTSVFAEEITTEEATEAVEPATEALETEAAPEDYYLTGSVDGINVVVEAPAEAFPNGATMQLTKVEAGTVEDAVQEAVENASVIAAVDIAFIDNNGEEVEPAAEVNVKITLDDASKINDDITVVHIPDEGEAETVEATVDGDTVEYAAGEFSVYAIVETGSTEDEARATLNFYGKDTSSPVATFYVKNADLTDDTLLNQIVYDPGVDGLSAGEIFKGWNVSSKDTTDGLDYTSSTKPQTIEDIRTFLKGLTIAEGDVYNIYAMIFQAYNVQFKDEDGAMIHGETLINKSGEAVSYKIGTDYTAKTEDQQFQGWYASTPVTDGITPVKETYQVGETVNIKGDVIFSPKAPKGNWLIFNSNPGTDTDNRASYTPPQFIETGHTGTQPTAPTRVGYTFGGWYTDAACTTTFNFSTVITTRTTVYAKWTEVSTAPYTVIIWKQRVTDDKNAADEDKTYDVWEVISLTGNTNSAITSVTQNGSNVNTGRTSPAQTRNIQVNGQQYAAAGFHCARYDSGKTVKANGTTVVNVYYDRNLITLNFTTGTGTYRNYYFNVGNGRVRTATMTGLFDAEIDFSWPSVGYSNATTTNTTNVLWSSQRYNGNLTFYGSYKLRTESDVNDTYTMTAGGTGSVYFYRQDENGNWPGENDYSNVAYVSSNSSSFTLTNKYAGFELHTYKSGAFVQNDNQWTTARVESNAYLSNGRLNIRFTRNKYPINFLDGTYFNGDGVTLKEATGVSLKTTEEIYYQASTASYNKGGANYYEPTAPAGYVFSGWYVDKTCTVPYNFTTMPEGGITVYARWVATQYRIFLHANVDPSDTSLDWGDQQMSFRVDEDEKLANGNKIIGTRDDYEIVGWYFDEAFTTPFNFDAYLINEELSYLEDYDQTEPTELNKYSNPTSTENKDATNNRVWINKKLNLYAKWRSTMKGSRGIQIIYDAVEGTNSANNQKEYTDPLYYLDTAKAIAQPASTPTDDTLHFVDWVVQKWDGSDWVDTSVKVSPGDSFEVLITNAYKEDNPDWDGVTENQQYLYTLKVRAEYGPKDTPTPTHITWYDNFTENPEVGTNFVTDDNLQINKAVDIEPADRFTRPDYKFLGWARVETTDSQGNPLDGYTLSPQDLTADDLYLVYDEESDTFTKAGTDKVVTQVAADEKYPYHDMYAVWQGVFYVYHSGVAGGDIEKHPADGTAIKPYEYFQDKYCVDGENKGNVLYGGYYVNDDCTPAEDGAAYALTADGPNWTWTTPGETTEYTPQLGDTIYLKEVPGNYLSPSMTYVYNTYKGNTLTQLYFLSSIDDKNYKDVGMDVEGLTYKGAYKKVVLKNKDTGKQTTYAFATIFKKFETEYGFVNVFDASAYMGAQSAYITMIPTWTTPDNIKVTGFTKKIMWNPKGIYNKTSGGIGSTNDDNVSTMTELN